MEINEDGLLVLKSTGWAKFSVQYPDVPKYSVTGANSQIVTVSLAENESVQTEPGTMLYKSGDVSTSTECGGCFNRCCSGESCCTMIMTNDASNMGFVGLTPNFPSKVVPVELTSKHVNGNILCKAGSYMAHYGDVEIETDFDFNPCRACFGGNGFIRQQLKGNGTVFLAATGTIMQKVLEEGEKIVIDTNCVLAWAETCEMTLQSAGGCCGMAVGGEGVFNTQLEGPGLVMVQSMSMEKFKLACAPRPNTVNSREHE